MQSLCWGEGRRVVHGVSKNSLSSGRSVGGVGVGTDPVTLGEG